MSGSGISPYAAMEDNGSPTVTEQPKAAKGTILTKKPPKPPTQEEVKLPCWAETLCRCFNGDFIREVLLNPRESPVYAVLVFVLAMTTIYFRVREQPNWLEPTVVCAFATGLIVLALWRLGAFRMDKIEHRLDKIEHRLDKIEHRLDKIEHRLDKIEQKFTKGFGDMETRFEDMVTIILMTEEEKQNLRAQRAVEAQRAAVAQKEAAEAKPATEQEADQTYDEEAARPESLCPLEEQDGIQLQSIGLSPRPRSSNVNGTNSDGLQENIHAATSVPNKKGL
jgi:tetrahydromethanopterin S-methyltransferase subunit G